MQKTNFSTTRLVCQPLEEKDICAFQQIVAEPHVQKFFKHDDPVEFLHSLEQYDCYPMGVYSASDSYLIGYINGYVYSKSNKEILVEFFLTESFYNFDYVAELLREFARHCQKLGFSTLRFELEWDDEDVKHLLNMSFIPAHMVPEEDYTDEQSGKRIHVFKIIF